MNKKQINYSILSIVLLFIASSFTASATSLEQSKLATVKDSIVLKHNFNDRTRTLYTGQKLKIWTENQRKQKGYLKSTTSNSLTITKGDVDVEILIKDIYKIKVYGDLFNSIEAGLLTVVGAGSFGIGGLYTLIVISGIEDFSASVLTVTIPMMAVGVGLVILAAHIYSRKFNIEKRWSIVSK